MSKLYPVNGWVVVEPFSSEEKQGSLYLPGNAKEVYKLGKVIAKSSHKDSFEVEEGDTVLYDSIGTVSVRIENNVYTMIKNVEVLSVVK